MQDVNSLTSVGGSIRAIIFDLAGTLIDYGSCAPAGAFVELFEAYQIEATMAQAREPMGMHKKEHIRTMLEMPELSRQWEGRQGRPWNEHDIELMYQDFIPLQLEALPNFGQLIPGALDTVTSLKKRGVLVGVSTGYNHEMLTLVLNQAADQGLVPDAAACGADVPAGRPAPWMIFQLMQTMAVYPPESVVKVGDTIADVEAGLNAGVWSVGVTCTGNMLGLSLEAYEALSPEDLKEKNAEAGRRMRQAGAHYVIDSVEDLPDVLHHIKERIIRRRVNL